MRFKNFLQNEEQSGTDKGLMGHGKSSSVRKPSDGQPFAKYLSNVAGQEPRPNSGSGGGGMNPMGGMFMKKKMKKS